MWILVVMIYLAQGEEYVLRGGGDDGTGRTSSNVQIIQPQMVMEMQEFSSKERCDVAGAKIENNLKEDFDRKMRYVIGCVQK